MNKAKAVLTTVLLSTLFLATTLPSFADETTPAQSNRYRSNVQQIPLAIQSGSRDSYRTASAQAPKRHTYQQISGMIIEDSGVNLQGIQEMASF